MGRGGDGAGEGRDGRRRKGAKEGEGRGGKGRDLPVQCEIASYVPVHLLL